MPIIQQSVRASSNYSTSVNSTDTITQTIALKWKTRTSVTIAGAGGNRWLLGGGYPPNQGTTSTTDVAWNTGGVASTGHQICYYQSPSAYGWCTAIQQADPIWTYDWLCYNYFYKMTTLQLIVDWADFFAQLNALSAKTLYDINTIIFYNPSTGAKFNFVDIMDIAAINNMWQSTTSGSTTNVNLFKTLDLGLEWADQTKLTIAGNLKYSELKSFTPTRIHSKDSNPTFESDVEALTSHINTCTSTSLFVPMTAQVYLSLKTADTAAPAGVVETNTDVSPELPDDPTGDELNDQTWGSEGDDGGSYTSDSGSTNGEGVNSVNILYGNSFIPFDSVYMLGATYNSFVAAGGGVITAGGVFPKSETCYISEIALSVEGSTMTVVEEVDADATKSFTDGERIYGYILKTAGDIQPTFAGYVYSSRRILDGQTEKIQYECRDFKFFLDQYFTQSHVYYQPPSYNGSGTAKSINRIIKEVLGYNSIYQANVDLPELTCPRIDWVFEPIKDVLDWACNYFGNYLYYIDRNGVLQVVKSDSGSVVKSYTIPARGGAVPANNPVLAFNPITDISRSRSRVVVCGDFILYERSQTFPIDFSIELAPENNAGNGFFWYRDTTNNEKHQYFIFHPSLPLLNQLLSDPKKSCKILLQGKQKVTRVVNGRERTRTETVEKEISPDIYTLQPLPSEIYCEQSDFESYDTLTITYAVRSMDPNILYFDTGLQGGTEVIKKPEFKLAYTKNGCEVNDTPTMYNYLHKIKGFYTTTYGGTLLVNDLDTAIRLMDKVTISGTAIPSAETTGLTIWGITYDCVGLKTTLELSNKTFLDLPYFDPVRERGQAANELQMKLGLLESQQLFQRL